MCHYITATLPHDAKLDALAADFRSHKFGFEMISNPHISSQIEAGDWYVLTTRGHCDCGTILGSLNTSAPDERVSYERELKKFRRQGWSEAKIKRWLEQKEQTKVKHRREDEARYKGSTAELNRWIGLITDVLESGHVRRIGVMLHMYERGIESERIDILGREKVELAELNPEQLMRMKEDVVYEFVV